MPQTRVLIELRRLLAALLPDALKTACSIANYKQGKIVIFAANGAVAAKLKLLRPGLAEQLSRRGWQVTGIEVAVQPPDGDKQAVVKPEKIGKNATDALARLEAQLPDSELKNAVARFLLRERENPQSK